MTIRWKTKKKGFTLVEVIVVLVILAILAAIMVPSLIGWIDKAKKKQVLLEARQSLQALQAVGYEYYGVGKIMPKADDSEVLALAELPEGASIDQAIVWSGSEKNIPPVSRMVYHSAKKINVVYEAGIFTVEDAYSANLGQESTIKSLTEIIKKYTSTMDSPAAGVTGSEAEKFVADLKNTDLDLGTMGATTWKLQNGQFLYWTPVDVSSLEIGDIIPVMRYNFQTGTYTVWQKKVAAGSGKSEGCNVLSLWDGNLLSSTSVAKDQTYDLMLKDYAAAVAKMSSGN